jgi:hypothetical protein
VTVAPGLLDRRLRVYGRTEAGADGFTRPLWVFLFERWGRLDAVSDTLEIVSTQSHREQNVGARVTFADGITVPPEAIIRDTADNPNALWLVTGVVKARQTRTIRVSVVSVADTATAYPTMESVEVLDGVHLVETRA